MMAAPFIQVRNGNVICIKAGQRCSNILNKERQRVLGTITGKPREQRTQSVYLTLNRIKRRALLFYRVFQEVL